VAIRVGINGFGRIGRLVFRVLMSRRDTFDVVAINDITSTEMLATLLKYDSTHRRYPGDVSHDAKHLIVDRQKIPVYALRNPAELPWGQLQVDVVLESSGVFTSRAGKDREGKFKPGYDTHLEAGAKKVVLSAPAKDEPDLTCVLGVNDHQLHAGLKCVSNASCTTNCLAPLAMVLHERFGIVKGLMTTVHAYTNDQRVQDLPHEDPYRARAASQNIIPTSTGAAKAVGLVIPELKGKLTGIAFRVPVATGSVVDLTAVMASEVKADEVNEALRLAAEGKLNVQKKDAAGKTTERTIDLRGILQYTEDPIVSSDIIGNPYSSIFSADWTQVMGGNLLKVVSWYDNEWGYSCRSADLIERLAKL
jgi:glyceraldehyde 3-phosphate dehydrogenase